MPRLLAFLPILLCAPVQAQTELSLVVELTKPPQPGAVIKVLVCSSVYCWANDADGSLYSEAAAHPTTRIRITDLPVGDYAMKVFVDENNNGKLDVNFIGIPTEPYGFSNNAMRPMGPPYYADATFTLREGMNVHRIKMR